MDRERYNENRSYDRWNRASQLNDTAVVLLAAGALLVMANKNQPSPNAVALSTPIAAAAITNVSNTYGPTFAQQLAAALPVAANAGELFTLLGYQSPSTPTLTYTFTPSDVRNYTSLLASKTAELNQDKTKYARLPSIGTQNVIDGLTAETNKIKLELQYGGLF